jgi:sugar/nucleoside kinase (ribokinase family)
MQATTNKDLPALLNELGVTATAVRIDHPESAPTWAIDRTKAYRVTIKYDGNRTSLYFYCGYGVKDAPSVADAVFALARDFDSTSYTLQEFGDEFGWNFETATMYRAVQRNGAKFLRLFPNFDIRLAIAESDY